MFWVRHGERADHLQSWYTLDHDNLADHVKYDPALSDEGKLQSFQAGMRIKEIISSMGLQAYSITLMVSPLLRTLQTATYL